MKTIKVSEATKIQLDWLVAKCEGDVEKDFLCGGVMHSGWHYSYAVNTWVELRHFRPSSDWSQGGPIIEREKIEIYWSTSFQQWHASYTGELCSSGASPLVSAMRCYVASKLGDEVEVPDELCTLPS